MPLRFRPTARVVGLALVAVLAAGADYRGCGAAPRPALPSDGAELPEGSGCLTDRDCVSQDMCVQLGCRGGTCEPIGGGPDGDGDGFEAAPCGEDCNDEDASRFPGARETCDGVDEDCDGETDEEAIGLTRYSVATQRTAPQMVVVADRLVSFGVDSSGALAGATIGDDGLVQQVFETGLSPRAFSVATRGETAALVVITEAGEVELRDVSLAGGGLSLGAPLSIGAGEDVARPRVHHFGGQDWVAWDHVAAPARRVLWRSGDASAVDLMAPSEPRTASLADDGTRLAITEGDFEVAFFDTAGALVSTVAAPGPFATDPLASGDGRVYVAFRDASDHALVAVRFDGLGSASLAPSGQRTDDVTLASVQMGDVRRVVFVRHESSTASASFFEEDLRTVAASFPMGTVRHADQFFISTVQVLSRSAGPAIHLGGGPASTLAAIGCSP